MKKNIFKGIMNSDRILLSAVVCSTFIIFWVGIQTHLSLVELLDQSRKSKKLTDCLNDIHHLDEVLTNSARLATTTGDQKWVERYHFYEPKLDEAIKKASRIEPSEEAQNKLLLVDSANLKLVTLEYRALELVHNGNAQEAKQLLTGNAYEKEKNNYANGLALFIKILDLKNIERDALIDRRTNHYYYIFFTAVAFSLMVWILLLKLRRNSRKELIKNNRLLDGEVQKRLRNEATLKMFEQTFKSINDVINIADLNDEIVFVNPAFCKTYGYTEEELIGKNSSFFWSERNPKEVVAQILPATLNGGWKGELFNKRKDGTEFPIYLSTSVIKNDFGEQIAVVGIVEDITERKRSELEHEVLNEITHGVTTTTNLNELLSLIHKSLGKVVYAENCFVALYDQKTKLFGFPYFVDKFDPTPEPFAMHKSCTVYIFRTGKPLLLTQELFDNLVEQNEVELVGTNAPSWVGVPLKTPERTIGVLVIQNYEEENVYSEGDVQFISSVGNQIALVIERKRAEEMIKESEKRFRTVVEEAAEVIFTTDNKGYFVYANPRAVKLSGYSLDELTKLKYIDLIEPEYKKIVARNYFKQYLSKEALTTTEYPFQTKTGEIKWFNQNARLIIENEEVRGFFVIARDVTELRKAEEAIRMNEEKFRTIANYTHDWEAWRTPDETFRYISPSCERISGHTVKEFMSDPNLIVQITHPDDRLMIIEHLRTSIHEDKSKDIELDFRILKPTGETRWLGHSCTAVYGEDGKWLGRRESNRDITDRKKTELIIQKQNNELQELNATKDKFFSIIAHDLRSPFQGFLVLTEMLTENISEFSNEEIVKYLGELNKSTQNIYKLLQNLLDWAQLKKGSFDFTPEEYSLSTVVSANIEQINKRAIQKGITILSDVPENQKIFVDERMINSILGNLLSNAVKFTREGGSVSIKAKTNSNGMVEISLEDSGVGMSESTINKLFKIDEKVGRKGTDGELSTGLGLLLCKEFVEKNGGKIWAESEEGKGSCFRFTIPFSS